MIAPEHIREFFTNKDYLLSKAEAFKFYPVKYHWNLYNNQIIDEGEGDISAIKISPKNHILAVSTSTGVFKVFDFRPLMENVHDPDC
jgi:hypothetical protein